MTNLNIKNEFYTKKQTSKQKKTKKQHRLSRVRAERALCGTTRPTAADPTANGNDPRYGDLLLSRAQPVAVQVLCGLATRVGIIAGGLHGERDCVKIKMQKSVKVQRILPFFVLGKFTIHISPPLVDTYLYSGLVQPSTRRSAVPARALCPRK
jgi:hypothetical protein